MASTTTQTTIANRALQLLGYQPIGSINDNSRGARAINRAYLPVLENCLRENFWSFAIKRAIVPSSSTTPAFGKANYFPLPGDFLMIAPPDQNTAYTFGAIPSTPIPSAPNNISQYNDWQIEAFPGGGIAIASSCKSPIYLRYMSSAVTESMFDPSFAEAFAAALAMEICEELTQSNTKIQTALKMYDDAIKLAKQRNAFEEMPVQAPVDPWILVRM
jgi:hypothetical protein